ncbi:membrane protein [Annulohypoxylon moriforme]|nr:membrane protein [Annulohypoxylon moriforme]
MGISGFLPPISPSLDAAQTAQHYRDHETGIRAGAALMIIASLFYVPYTMVVSAQMQRIPNLHPIVMSVQSAAGVTSMFSLTISGLLLAINAYRLDRPVEITQLLNDMFWFVWAMTWPTFIVQFTTLASAVIVDRRPKPLFPKPLAMLAIFVSVIVMPGNLSVHCFKTGPLAWNGAMGFWIPAVSWAVLVTTELVCLIRSIPAETTFKKEASCANTANVGTGANGKFNKGGDAMDGVSV